MTPPRDTVHVHVEQVSDDGGTTYVASCDELAFTTEGETYERVMQHIRECLELCLVDVDTLADYNVVPNPRVEIVLNIPANAYAETSQT